MTDQTKQPASKTNSKKQFNQELQKSLLLDDTVKQYWLANADNLPEELLQNLYGVVKTKNDKIDEYIRVALANDPDHQILNELRTTIAKIKKDALGLEEKSQSIDPEAELEAQLKNLK